MRPDGIFPLSPSLSQSPQIVQLLHDGIHVSVQYVVESVPFILNAPFHVKACKGILSSELRMDMDYLISRLMGSRRQDRDVRRYTLSSYRSSEEAT